VKNRFRVAFIPCYATFTNIHVSKKEFRLVIRNAINALTSYALLPTRECRTTEECNAGRREKKKRSKALPFERPKRLS